MTTETTLRKALDAADDGTFFDGPYHSSTVRSAVVLHLVRSIAALLVSDETWRDSRAWHVDQWMQHREHLFWMHREHFGWFPSSDQELRIMANELI
ncbi:hypothetical protein, partial [Streptomyces sp. NPDC127574]